MAKKIDNVEIKIEDFIFPNKGTAHYNGVKAEIANALPGQTVKCSLYKKKGKYVSNSFEIIKGADGEIPSDCPSFGSCGGCVFRTLPYERELELKKKTVFDILKAADIGDIRFDGIKSSHNIDCYRNKMEFSFGDTGLGGELSLGMRKRNSFYEVASAAECKIVCEDIRKILAATLDFFKNTDEKFYNRLRKEGSLRHLLVRRAQFTGEILVALVSTSSLHTDLTPLAESLLSLSLEGNITGILHIINDGAADVVRADKTKILFGRDYIYEKLLGLTFKISLFSFFQTNSGGAEILYDTVRTYAGNEPNRTIYDLYCGTGTIAQLLSTNAKQVIGIEIVEEAVEAAKINAALNNIQNCTFIAADVLSAIDSLPSRPDTIVLDPPREGLHPKALSKICQNLCAPSIIYVSCKPTSLARDLPLFRLHNYTPSRLTLIDLFPRTQHVETVVMLSHKKPDSVINVKVEFGEGEVKVPLDNIAKRAEAHKPKERVTYKMI